MLVPRLLVVGWRGGGRRGARTSCMLSFPDPKMEDGWTAAAEKKRRIDNDSDVLRAFRLSPPPTPRPCPSPYSCQHMPRATDYRDNLRTAATLTETQEKNPFGFLPISFSLSPYGQHELLSFLAPSCRRRPSPLTCPLPTLSSFCFSTTAENGISYASIPSFSLSLSLSLSLQLSFQSVKRGHNRP